MLRLARNTLLALTAVLVPFAGGQDTAPPKSGPEYTADSRLKYPGKFREWIFLTSGIDMSYSPMSGMSHHMFDNVFVNPEAYKAFLETGDLARQDHAGARDARRANQGFHQSERPLPGCRRHGNGSSREG